jgi:hypothetical protein
VADAGGYLGLLMGASILSIYDFITGYAAGIIKKKTTPIH